MEIAHRRTGVLRIIAKFVLLGLLVVLLAKAILAVVGLALLGFAIYLCARTVYLRRSALSRIPAWTKERLMYSVGAAFRLIAAIAVMSGWFLLGTVLICRLLCGLASNGARIGVGVAGESLRQFTKILAWTVLTVFFYGGKTVAACARVAQAVPAAGEKIKTVSGPICGTLVEVASGALVGAILLNLQTVQGLLFLPEVEDVGARACTAAIFGAFLGITLALSRATWARQGETNIDSN